MEWGNGGTFRKVATTGYQVEHILEWQLVTNFFDWMNVEYNGGQSKFDNPKGGVKVDFCEHWKGTWANTKAFTISGKPVAYNPLDFIRKEFPSTTNDFKNEFVWLESTINSPAKAQVSFLYFSLQVSMADYIPT
jgi:hypothetical protein